MCNNNQQSCFFPYIGSDKKKVQENVWAQANGMTYDRSVKMFLHGEDLVCLHTKHVEA